jgi:o-succinylbenzoate synthase
MKVGLAPIALTFRRPIRTAHGVLHERSGWLVSVEDGGIQGVGEAAPWAAFGTETPAACLEALTRFELDEVPGSVEAVEGAVAPLKGTPAAQAGVEAALLDQLAHRHGVRVAALLSDSVAEELEVNALIDGGDAAALARDAEAAARLGFRVVKVKVGSFPLSVDAQRLYAVRRAVGPKVALRIDANGAWSESTARSALRGLESLELELCEQPVAAADLEGLRRLRRQVSCRLAADEALAVPERWARLLELDPDAAAAVLVLKPMVLGGLLPALRLARQAERVGCACYVTSLLDGPVARAAASHLAAVLPRSGLAHGLSTVELFERQEGDPYAPLRGNLRLPSGCGWGLR